MKLTIKLLLLFTLAIATVTSVFGYLAVRREEEIFQERSRREALRFAEAMRRSLKDEWDEVSGPGRLARLLSTEPFQPYSVRVRWVWFDDRDNDRFSPSVAYSWDSISTQETVSLVAVNSNGRSNLYTYLPMRNRAGRAGGLEFTTSMEELESAKRAMIGQTLGTLAIMMVTVGSITFLLGLVYLGKPLRRIAEKTRRAGEGDLSGPVHVSGSDELGELATSINEMCDRIQESQRRAEQESVERLAAMDQLRHADRLRTVGRLASGIAHELGTPLNVVAGRADLIASGELDKTELRENADSIRRETERMTTIIRQLLDFARRGESTRTKTDLRSTINTTCQLLAPLAAKQNVQLVFEPSDEPREAVIDPGQMQQVLTNILVNAVHSMEQGGEVRVQLSTVVARPPSGSAEQDYICISVADTGSGIAAQDLPHIFEPFFTTKGVGEGTGLGLSIAHGIVEEHNGWIKVESQANVGSTFRMFLPQA